MMLQGLRAAAVAVLLALAGCADSGHSFDSLQMASLTPGRTTLAEAAYILQAAPDQIYPQSDGTTLAFWRYHATIVTDAIYGRQEALLQFGPDGRLMRMVDSTNVLLAPSARRKLLGVPPPPDVVLQPPPVAVSNEATVPQVYAIPVPDAPPLAQ